MAQWFADFEGETDVADVLEYEPWSPGTGGDLALDADPNWDDTPAVGWSSSGGSTRKFARLINAPSSNNVEVYGLFQLQSGGEHDIYVGGSGDNGYTAYKVDVRGPDIDDPKEIRITKFFEGSADFGITSASIDFDEGDVLHVRFRWNAGTSEIKARVWLDGNSEPSSWDVETTDSDITDSGTIGLFNYGNTFYYSRIGVGTDGDPAPTSSVSDNLGLVIEPAASQSAFGARAVVRSSITEAVASADSDTNTAAGLSSLTAPALSDEALNALSSAAAAIVAGSAADDAWTARAAALAALIDEGAASEDVYQEATQLFEELITESSAAAGQFLGGARVLASLSAGATPTEAITTLVTAVGTLTGTSRAGAVFTRATGKLLAELTESARAAGVFSGVAAATATAVFAVASNAIFSAQEAGRRYLVLGAVTLTAALDAAVQLDPELRADDLGFGPGLDIDDAGLDPSN